MRQKWKFGGLKWNKNLTFWVKVWYWKVKGNLWGSSCNYGLLKSISANEDLTSGLTLSLFSFSFSGPPLKIYHLADLSLTPLPLFLSPRSFLPLSHSFSTSYGHAQNFGHYLSCVDMRQLTMKFRPSNKDAGSPAPGWSETSPHGGEWGGGATSFLTIFRPTPLVFPVDLNSFGFPASC